MNECTALSQKCQYTMSTFLAATVIIISLSTLTLERNLRIKDKLD